MVDRGRPPTVRELDRIDFYIDAVFTIILLVLDIRVFLHGSMASAAD